MSRFVTMATELIDDFATKAIGIVDENKVVILIRTRENIGLLSPSRYEARYSFSKLANDVFVKKRCESFIKLRSDRALFVLQVAQEYVYARQHRIERFGKAVFPLLLLGFGFLPFSRLGPADIP